MHHLRSTIKGQALSDFIVKLSNMSKDSIIEPLWRLETDGSSKVVRGGTSMVLQYSEGLLVTHVVNFSFFISNNDAEYDVVLLNLRVARALSAISLELQCDSQLVASQIQGE